MRNNIVFDEEQFTNDIKDKIKLGFKNDTNTNWFSVFGNKEINFSIVEDKFSDTFPTIDIEVTGIPYERSMDSGQVANHTQFTIDIYVYNKEGKNGKEKINRKVLSMRMAKMINYIIQTNYGLVANSDSYLPNQDPSVCRRLITYTGVIDNKNKYIFNKI